MQLKEFINRMDGVNPELKLFCNENTVYDVVIQNDKIVLKFENPLELYYTHKGKMDNLKEMITAIKNDSADVEEVSEIEVVEIAHNLKLGFNEVKKEFIKNGIGVNVL